MAPATIAASSPGTDLKMMNSTVTTPSAIERHHREALQEETEHRS